jgi:hypothetical protein
LALLLILGGAVGAWQYANHEECPTPSNFSEKFNQWSIEFLDGHPEYGEKEQREGWDKHLEEMGCIEEQNIINNAICADCEDNTL